MDRLNGLAV